MDLYVYLAVLQLKDKDITFVTSEQIIVAKIVLVSLDISATVQRVERVTTSEAQINRCFCTCAYYFCYT